MRCEPVENNRVQDTVAMRDAYCGELIRLAEENSNILAIEADVMASMGTTAFAKKFPDRSINCGIQEQNAVGVASALSLMGYIPFFHAFGIFATRRVFDQVFLSCGYAGGNVKIIGGDAGITAAANGGTHMPFEDLALMRAVPNMVVLEPADAVAIRALTPQLVALEGNAYMRSCRRQVIRVYGDDAQFKIGRANMLREGSDVTLVACGILVHEALTAAEMLAEEGVSARVIDCFTVKPIDREAIISCARETGAVVVAENHNRVGGLGDAVTDVLCAEYPVPVEKIGANESFGEVGTVSYLMDRFGMSAKHIAEAARRAIARKNK